ncbi:RNA-binding domain-containing protein [Cystobasidium minutum MCA 4210]|uniref:RNA-binding domain-containing protein n=1 Tax=Cystobasidium minutum MCA 4210 TaxID=1397322 RepID=UPI0034CF8F84|eukprot:jgi/Rhomi1/167248/fgenesh1_kg.2_\
MDDYDRSPVDRRDDYSRSRRRDSPPPPPAGPARGRSRSRSPPRRSAAGGYRDRSPGDRYRGGPGDRRRSRSPPPRGGGRYEDDGRYPHSATRGGGHGGYRGGYSSRGGGRGGYRGGYSSSAAIEPRSSNREAAAQEAIKSSKKENRVYIGNLSFSVRWHDLKDFCSSVGTVVFTEIIQLPNGMSKGCGIVEFSTREEALRAISELNEQVLMGRPVYLREDREDDARYGSAAISNRSSFPGAALQVPHEGRRGPPVGVPAAFAPPGPRGLFITGMTPAIGWQDLKDLFRAAGEVVRADINIDHSTGISKGTGVVVMSSKSEADAAIAMFNGYEFDGGRLDVREDRFFHINQARQAQGGRGGFSRGGARGDYAGAAGGRSTDNLYGDYAGPGGRDDRYEDGGFRSGYSDRGAPGGPRGGRGGPPPAAHIPFEAPPSTQIFVKNLPWSTSNEDLVELFQTTGTVQEAEIIYENGRSKGSGIVQFASIEEAETAILKFQNYQYGGRPIGLGFNARWKDFTGAGVTSNPNARSDLDGAQNGDSHEVTMADTLPQEDPATDGMKEEPAVEGM